MRRRTQFLLAAASGGALLAGGLGITNAHAEDSFTDPAKVAEFIRDCDNAHSCTWTADPGDAVKVRGPEHQVGFAVFWCGPNTVSAPLTVKDTIANKVNTNLEASVEGQLGQEGVAAVKAGFKVATGLEFTDTVEFSQTFNLNLAPNDIAWVTHSAVLEQRDGTLRLQYGSPKDGHFKWSVHPVTTVTATGSAGALVGHQRQMTAEEQASFCSQGPGPLPGSPPVERDETGLGHIDQQMTDTADTTKTTLKDFDQPNLPEEFSSSAASGSSEDGS